MGPVGQLTSPLGPLEVDEVYEAYAEQARILEEEGVDLILIETQIDVLEGQTALRAAKENTSLPVSLSLSYPMEGGMTVTGSDPESASVAITSTPADIFGINCGDHPEDYESFIKKINQQTLYFNGIKEGVEIVVEPLINVSEKTKVKILEN